MSIKLILEIDNQTDFKFNKALAKQAILDVLVEKKLAGEYEVDLELTDTDDIQKLNKEYRKKDEPTDVLSFPIYHSTAEMTKGPILLGDIVLCPEIMAQNAKTYNNSTEDEFTKLLAHSTLHLLGYHHKED